MDLQLFRILGQTAGLAGLAIGMILVLYRALIQKAAIPKLSAPAYHLLGRIALYSFCLGALGIICWTFSFAISHSAQHATMDSGDSPEASLVIAGTVVDESTNMGIGQATIVIDGQSSSSVSEDTGNFRLVLSGSDKEPVRLSVTKEGYFKVDQSVIPPTHSLIVQMRRKTR